MPARVRHEGVNQRYQFVVPFVRYRLRLRFHSNRKVRSPLQALQLSAFAYFTPQFFLDAEAIFFMSLNASATILR